MSDDLKNRGEPDRSLSLSEEHEVRYWLRRFARGARTNRSVGPWAKPTLVKRGLQKPV